MSGPSGGKLRDSLSTTASKCKYYSSVWGAHIFLFFLCARKCYWDVFLAYIVAFAYQVLLCAISRAQDAGRNPRKRDYCPTSTPKTVKVCRKPAPGLIVTWFGDLLNTNKPSRWIRNSLVFFLRRRYILCIVNSDMLLILSCDVPIHTGPNYVHLHLPVAHTPYSEMK